MIDKDIKSNKLKEEFKVDFVPEAEEEKRTRLETKRAKYNNSTMNKKVRELDYDPHFDEKQDISTFKIDIKEDGKYIFFTEHFPTEFETNEHFLKI